jgi:hypothetical protein
VIRLAVRRVRVTTLVVAAAGAMMNLTTTMRRHPLSLALLAQYQELLACVRFGRLLFGRGVVMVLFVIVCTDCFIVVVDNDRHWTTRRAAKESWTRHGERDREREMYSHTGTHKSAGGSYR